MHEEQRTVRFDRALGVEAFRLQGVIQRFPNHFHAHYVIGYLEGGQRVLTCAGQEFRLGPGDLTLFEPGQTHACAQLGGAPLDYRGLNVPPARMEAAAREFFGEEVPLHFASPVVYRSELAPSLRALHEMIMRGDAEFDREEALLLLLRQLFAEHAAPRADALGEGNEAIEAVCAYLETHYGEPVSLDTLGAVASLSKYHLLRAFTRAKGISPYQYLTTVRLSEAKRLLEAGVPPVETALRTGFSDQSHFTNVFKSRIGLTPKQYQSIF